jgi:chromate reductase
MNAPEAYIQFTPNLISDEGRVSVESLEKFLRNFMAEFTRSSAESSKPPKNA